MHIPPLCAMMINLLLGFCICLFCFSDRFRLCVSVSACLHVAACYSLFTCSILKNTVFYFFLCAQDCTYSALHSVYDK